MHAVQKPKKSLGQHFLKCQWVVSALINASELTSTDAVLEIGPGDGILTRTLANHAGRVIAVEKDERLAANLAETLTQEGIKNVEIIPADILTRFNLVHIPRTYKIVANIPYYLTSRLLRMLFEQQKKPQRVVLTIQKEVAERICARAPHMNILALSVQAYGAPKMIKTVPASCFSPKPRVDSAIIAITDISNNFFKKNNISEEMFFKIIRRAFSQKRKILANALSPLYTKKNLEKIYTSIGIKSNARAEELALEQWARFMQFISRE